MSIVYVKVTANPVNSLAKQGFGIDMQNKGLSREGKRYKMPRSVERAIKAKGRGDYVEPFRFILEEIVVPSQKVRDEAKKQRDNFLANNPAKFSIKSPKTGKKKVCDNINQVRDTIMEWDKEQSKVTAIYKPLSKGKVNWQQWNFPSLCEPKTAKLKDEPKYVLTDSVISFFHAGQSYSTSKSNPMFDTVVKSLKDGDIATAVQLCNIANAIEISSDGIIKNEGGTLKHNGVDLHETCQEYILRNMHKGENAIKFAVNFLARCKLNPNQDSIKQLWNFIRANEFIIFPTGEFLAYKFIRENLKDDWSNTFDNSVGSVVEMPRNEVVFDPEQTCQKGLHLCRYEFCQTRPNIIEAKCCPSNVCSVPVDYDGAKLRCCKYEVWKLIRHKGQDVAPRTTQEEFFTL